MKTKQTSLPLLSLIPLFMVMPLVLFLCGCASRYKEPTVAEGRTAYIETFGAVQIVSIDRKNVPASTPQENQGFRIAPGEHVVNVRYLGEVGPDAVRYSNDALPVKFTAVPNYTYLVSGSSEGTTWKARIVRGSARLREN